MLIVGNRSGLNKYSNAQGSLYARYFSRMHTLKRIRFGGRRFARQKSLFSTYEIEIVTGDRRGAATDANVFLSLFDAEANEYQVPIETAISFKRNSSVKVVLDDVQISSIDDICKVRVGHDGDSDIGSGWFLDRIVLYNAPKRCKENTSFKKEFVLCEWIGKSDSGGIDGPEVRDIECFNDENLEATVFEIESLPKKSPYRLVAGGFCTPHPEKVKRGEKAVCKRTFGFGGEDAYFTDGANGNFLGVADGIFEWRERGIDAGEFSRALITGASEYVLDANRKNNFVTSKDVFRAAAKHARDSHLQGSSTLCIFGLVSYEGLHEMKAPVVHNNVKNITSIGKQKISPTHFDSNNGLNNIMASLLEPRNGYTAMLGQITNLGDSGVMIGRPSTGEIIFRTSQQEHDFGFPYQLGHEGIADGVDDAETYLVGNIIEGDIIIAGTDGSFDNLSDEQIMQLAKSNLHESPGSISMQLVTAAFEASIDKKAVTPYSTAATEEFNIIYQGGKKDDIACVFGLVVPV